LERKRFQSPEFRSSTNVWLIPERTGVGWSRSLTRQENRFGNGLIHLCPLMVEMPLHPHVNTFCCQRTGKFFRSMTRLSALAFWFLNRKLPFRILKIFFFLPQLTWGIDGKTLIGLGVFFLFPQVGNTIPDWAGFLHHLSPSIRSGSMINRLAGAGRDRQFILIFGGIHLLVGFIF